MLEDITAVMWKEFKEYLVRFNSKLDNVIITLSIPLILIGYFGVYSPLSIGHVMTGSITTMFILLLSPFLVANLLIEEFVGERVKYTLNTLLASRLTDTSILLGKMCAALTYVCLPLVVGFFIGIITTIITHGPNGLLDNGILNEFTLLAIALLSCSIMASISSLVSMKSLTVMEAQLRMIVVIFVMLVLFVILPIIANLFYSGLVKWIVSAILSFNLVYLGLATVITMIIINVIFFVAALSGFKRFKLLQI